MELDDQNTAGVEAAEGGPSKVEANMMASGRLEEDQRFPEDILDECVRFFRPESYDGG